MQDASEYNPSPRNTALIFLGVLTAALALQMTLWLSFPIADESWWAPDAAKIAAGTTLTPQDITYVHPGTTMLYPMATLIHSGVDPKTAVRVVMAAFAAICIALASALAYRVRPQNLWWLAVALILVADLRLLHGTPPSTAAALLTVVFVLLLLHARATRHPDSYRPMVYLGVCLGLLLATRFDTGAFILITTLPFLLYMFRLRVLVLLASAALVCVAANPHAWTDPLLYFSSIPQQIFANKALVGIDILVPFLLTFPFAILSICVSLAVVYRQSFHSRDNDVRVPLDVYLWFLGATLLITLLLAPLSFHPIRYYMPFYLTWDILLPFFLLVFARQHFPHPRYPWLTERRCEWAVIALIVATIAFRFVIFLTADTREIIL
ncbi:hypothetical protein A2763_00305 [Candidatus Kaiserbacteria bacterium RIFCSPHIGHO2_01_FULL_54_36]|uniref:Glycosyltransferase RgtA/B/C/D-like domain-containing protein n=1 Tax=Candidatus Kaiserbacteria bacterium RIFCSPHIGHO2_01_FULL_54_36 TaxID=1798482 RepID=A0A1F6CLK2_9BACT|nr:MAG: hypothetical protein A2763_00305 [Candidatus Kaiserbacteria bacterium RIFCSPHIGHO2_01_FULL_54_36]OGG75679.1 MAG: hypothetical protein A3A41_04720 [Candidatus Kaiserbacteria bacterium RIFCSPLOWO2_01_FULL_54_22]